MRDDEHLKQEIEKARKPHPEPVRERGLCDLCNNLRELVDGVCCGCVPLHRGKKKK